MNFLRALSRYEHIEPILSPFARDTNGVLDHRLLEGMRRFLREEVVRLVGDDQDRSLRIALLPEVSKRGQRHDRLLILMAKSAQIEHKHAPVFTKRARQRSTFRRRPYIPLRHIKII